MHGVRFCEKECPKLSNYGDFCITASFIVYPLEDAVIAGVNTRIVVLTFCMKDFNVVYETLKYRARNAYLTRFLAAVVI